jgi:hypothetical protein
MDEFQAVIREMQDEELRLLVLRDADVKRNLGQTKALPILVTVLAWWQRRAAAEFLRVAKSFDSFWLSVVKLPREACP